jgi:hypothetical protein
MEAEPHGQPWHPPAIPPAHPGPAKTDPFSPGAAKTGAFPPKKPLDPLVKIALGLSLGLILITIIGMILTAPDRSIPPYSVMAQMGETVTVSVPPNTTDAQIEALLFRFRAALESDREGFRRLKIKPTTPNDPGGHYQRVTIYVLDNPGLAEESVLRDYLAGDPAARGAFKRSVRGIYRLTPGIEIGVLGYADEDVKLALGEANRPRILFQTQRGTN